MGKVAVVGAGIIGLYTALLLSEAGISHDIVVIAKNLPGDYSIDYTSPIAGAHFSYGIATESKQLLEYCKVSYSLLKKLFKKFENHLEEAGLERLPQIELSDTEPSQEFVDAISEIADNFSLIQDEAWLKEKGAVSGMVYDTFNFFTPKFLVFLKKYLESKGVEFVRYSLNSLSEVPKAAGVRAIPAVFNCTGVLATKLSDVHDENANYPIRGQVVTVLAPWIRENLGISRVGVAPTYIIPRPHSGGHVILGGYYDKNDWTESAIAEQTQSIIERTTTLCPELLKEGPLHIIGERPGLRPGRDGGPRIEHEVINGLNVIHNYGAAGTGYQCGLGMVTQALEIYFGTAVHSAKL